MSLLWSAPSGQALNVNATLNGGTATLTVYEDENNDGTPENTEEISITDGDNGYDLPSFSQTAGNDYWWHLDAQPASETARVEINSIEISG